MDDLLSEKEQIDQFRSWWSEYGAYVIGGIVIGAGMLIGINYYQSAKLEAQLAASTAYEALIAQVVDGDLDEAEAIANEIATEFGDTTYVGQAGLAMARLYMDKNRDQDAADALQTVIDGNANDELKQVARLRLARIYLYQDKAQEVLDLLAGNDVEAFASAYGEILGDAYTALGRIAEAQDAYQKILMNPASQSTVDQQLVQWKALDLPDVTSLPETSEPEPSETVEQDASDSEEVE
ncbi:MAG: tetratricopeptide repeat protein [Gammaproteobacteria bacterium]|nr:tetratricopeptide repeat protein [Gammaproteobacteria bacterium]